MPKMKLSEAHTEHDDAHTEHDDAVTELANHDREFAEPRMGISEAERRLTELESQLTEAKNRSPTLDHTMLELLVAITSDNLANLKGRLASEAKLVVSENGRVA